MDVSELTKTSAKLSWKPPSNDGGSPLTGYIIEKKEGRRTTWARCDKISPDVTTYNVKNLTEGTEYLFRVTAENKIGVSPVLETDQSIIPKSKFGKCFVSWILDICKVVRCFGLSWKQHAS